MEPVRILLAEDDPEHQCLLHLAVRGGRPHVAISTAYNRDEFVAQIEAQSFDCAVIDFNLADSRANELLRILSEIQPACPAIVVSADNSINAVVESFRSGSADFVAKHEAILGDTLWKRIEHACANARRTERKRRKIQRRHQRMVALAETDPLTGLANRRHVDRILLGNGRKTFDRRGKASVILFDLDHFKRINDHYGHIAGDRVLRVVAETIRRQVRPNDIVARWGGEEFVVIRPACNLAQGVYWAERFRRSIAARSIELSDDDEVTVTLSAGVAAVDSHELSVHTLDRADQALYAAKNLGRDRVCTWEFVAFRRLLRTLPGNTFEQRLQQMHTRTRALVGHVQLEYLTDHALAVGRVCTLIANALGLDRRTTGRLQLAARCHDLGKILVPESILAKQRPLTREEWHLLSRHAVDGAELAKEMGADGVIAGYIRHHHDRFNTSESDVPFEAHVLAVADAYVAMVTARPYQTTRSRTAALHELRRGRGTQFHPQVVDVAIPALTRHALGLPAADSACDPINTARFASNLTNTVRAAIRAIRPHHLAGGFPPNAELSRKTGRRI